MRYNAQPCRRPSPRFSRLFIPTLKEAPTDAQVVSHKLLVRAGFIRQLGAGIYDYLPLAKRTLSRIAAIIRDEKDAFASAPNAVACVEVMVCVEPSGKLAPYHDPPGP